MEPNNNNNLSEFDLLLLVHKQIMQTFDRPVKTNPESYKDGELDNDSPDF